MIMMPAFEVGQITCTKHTEKGVLQTWIMKIKIGLLESYVAGFLPLKIPACATLAVVEFDDIFPLLLVSGQTEIMRETWIQDA